MSSYSLPYGTEILSEGVSFRVWAPDARNVVLIAGTDRLAQRNMSPTGDGSWQLNLPEARPGWHYGYLVDGAGPFPDPFSRDQPAGVHALSRVVEPNAYQWNDSGWHAPAPADTIIYEMHVGTATPEGTFDSLHAILPRLKKLGITTIELMPVGSFPGARGWGYDNVAIFAPQASYGGPNGLKRFIDAAHQEGLAVILDVIYNHLGPAGNYLGVYDKNYVTDRHHTPWGPALNFETCPMMREWAIGNASYWLAEYHLDGLRLDATDHILDGGKVHVLRALTEQARQAAGRPVFLVAENDSNDERFVRPAADGGYGFDAVWADDFHHAVHTALTKETDGYYKKYNGTLAEIAKAIHDGWLRGGAAPEDIAARRFVFCLQNHDQVGNRPVGDRLPHLAGHARYRAALPLLFLSPETPLMFMGDEWALDTPFLYFTDHEPDLGKLVTDGRRNEFANFASFAAHHEKDAIPDPQSPTTFALSKLPEPDEEGIATEQLVTDLIALRRDDRTFRDTPRLAVQTEATDTTLALTWPGRRLIVNIGDSPVTVPVGDEDVILATNDRRYGGTGESVDRLGKTWRIPAAAAVILRSNA